MCDLMPIRQRKDFWKLKCILSIYQAMYLFTNDELK